MNYKHIVLATALSLSSVSASAFDFGVGTKIGSTGAGVDLSVTLTKTINARISLTSLDFGSVDESFAIESGTAGVDQNIANFDASIAFDMGTTGLLFDWYIFDGTFHLTGGMIKNNSSFKFEGTLTGTDVTFGGTTYNISNDLVDNKISGEISLGDSYEPYIGIGWGRKASSDSGLSLSVEFGFMLLSPTVDLKAPVLVDTTQQAQIEADVNAAEADAADELSALEAYPVISVGLNYAF